MRARLIALVAPFTLIACQDPLKDTAGVEAYDSDLGGVVFKGPMQVGGAVTLQAIDPEGADDGDPVSTTVSDASGAYSGHLSHDGLVRVTAEGTTFDEARGEAGSETIRLVAYAEVGGGAQQVQVNLITDLTHPRVEALLATGGTLSDAITTSRQELLASLPFGVAAVSGEDEGSFAPYDPGDGAAFLFALSSVLAQAGKDSEEAGGGTLGELLDGMREDLADDGALVEEVQALIHDAEPRLDPDLATLSLTALLQDAGLDYTVPDLHLALDSDQDGVLNTDDNCRYVSNPGQADPEGLGFGEDCDYRLLSISTSNHWGCGVLGTTGELACWETNGEPTGGTPPRPEVFPAHVSDPWGGGEYLTGTYTAVGSGDNIVCALSATAMECWTMEGGATTVEGEFTTLRLSSSVGCAIDGDGEAACVDNQGDVLDVEDGPWLDLSTYGDGSVVGVRGDGTLAWAYDAGTGTLPALEEGTFSRVVTSNRGWGCALGAADGALTCFGGGELEARAPTTGSYVDVAVGSGIGCVVGSDGSLTWWRDETQCPIVDGSPLKLWGVSAAGCQICGVDETGLGQCWPRYWDSARAAEG